MCGLVGVIGKIGQDERKAFKNLLQLDTVRGPHSTGVCRVDKKLDATIWKVDGTPWDFEWYYDKRLTNGLMPHDTVALIGHNRWATVGAVNVKNAHPFHIGDLYGAHNGTMTKNLLDKLNKKDYEVDSQMLYDTINEHGVHKAYPKMHGAWALTWFNEKTKKMNFLRNHQRPLYMCRSKDKKTLFWASEDWMLVVALGKYKIKYDEITQIETDHLYSFDLKDVDKDIKLFKSKRLKSYEYPKSVVQNHVGFLNGSNANVVKKDKPKKSDEYMDMVGKADALTKKRRGKPLGFYITEVKLSEWGYYNAFGYELESGMPIKLFVGHENDHTDYAEWLRDNDAWYIGTVATYQVMEKVGNPSDVEIGVILRASETKGPHSWQDIGKEAEWIKEMPKHLNHLENYWAENKKRLIKEMKEEKEAIATVKRTTEGDNIVPFSPKADTPKTKLNLDTTCLATQSPKMNWRERCSMAVRGVLTNLT